MRRYAWRSAALSGKEDWETFMKQTAGLINGSLGQRLSKKR